MNKFLIKIGIFITPFLLYFIVNMSINYGIYSTQAVKIENVRVLILGDSHIEKGINPKLFKSAQNISQPGESYIMTYWKLKKILETNKPDTIVLGYSPHNISKYSDYRFSDDEVSQEMFRRIYPISNFAELTDSIPVDYTGFLKVFWKQTALYPKTHHFNFVGFYLNDTSNHLTNPDKAIQRHYYRDDKQLGVSEVSIGYLDSIITLSKRHKIPIILAGSPLHKLYYNAIPDEIISRYELLNETYKNKVLLFDETKNRTYADSTFYDYDHLNAYGSKKFTAELIEFLKK